MVIYIYILNTIYIKQDQMVIYIYIMNTIYKTGLDGNLYLYLAYNEYKKQDQMVTIIYILNKIFQVKYKFYLLKEFNLFHKLSFSNPCIFAMI